eukprot:3868073-Heterocapsa_arctica.AAC.1
MAPVNDYFGIEQLEEAIDDLKPEFAEFAYWAPVQGGQPRATALAAPLRRAPWRLRRPVGCRGKLRRPLRAAE